MCAARGARYARNCEQLITGMQALGFQSFLPRALQAPIIVTFHAPANKGYDFKRFYAAAKARGFILYPGKLTQVETFRVGCMGQLGGDGMSGAVKAIAEALKAIGVTRTAPAQPVGTAATA